MVPVVAMQPIVPLPLPVAVVPDPTPVIPNAAGDAGILESVCGDSRPRLSVERSSTLLMLGRFVEIPGPSDRRTAVGGCPHFRSYSSTTVMP